MFKLMTIEEVLALPDVSHWRASMTLEGGREIPIPPFPVQRELPSYPEDTIFVDGAGNHWEICRLSDGSLARFLFRKGVNQ